MGAPLSLICRTALWGEFRSCQPPTTVSTSLFFVKTTDPWCYRIPPPGGVFLSPGFPCPECMLDTYYPPPRFWCSRYRLGCVAGHNAGLLDRYAPGTPASFASSLVYALRTAVLPAVSIRTRVSSFLSLWCARHSVLTCFWSTRHYIYFFRFRPTWFRTSNVTAFSACAIRGGGHI